MPWELGFKDGANKRTGIVPVVQVARNTFDGEEYLGLYPYVDRELSNANTRALWINRTFNEYASFSKWVRGEEQITVSSLATLTPLWSAPLGVDRIKLLI